MWNYEKRLEYPIKIKQTNPALAAMIISQYGGPYFNKIYGFSSYLYVYSITAVLYVKSNNSCYHFAASNTRNAH